MMGDRMLNCRRLTRVHYRGHLFKYPLEPIDILAGLGRIEALKGLVSYFRTCLKGRVEIRNFEDWVISRFGRRLYEAFFKTYTEKVWGVSCSEISADWAAQRIKGFSVAALAKDLLLGRQGSPVVKTLIDSFRYPRRGPGELWDTVARRVVNAGGSIKLGEEVVAIANAGDSIVAIEMRGPNGPHRYVAKHYVSTIPIRDLIRTMRSVPEKTVAAAANLAYRDILIVALLMNQPKLFPDHWIYVHDPGVKVARIENFRNWSPDMSADPGQTLLGLEYFCSRHDSLWNMSDSELFQLAESEIESSAYAMAQTPTAALSYVNWMRIQYTPTTTSNLSTPLKNSPPPKFETYSLRAETECTNTTTRIMQCSPDLWLPGTSLAEASILGE